MIDKTKPERTRKRVQVLLMPEIYDEVEKISKLGGVPMGVLLAELLADSKPALVLIREALEAAKKQDLSLALERLQSAVLGGIGDGVELSKAIHNEKSKFDK